MNRQIGIVDYGVNNVSSVGKALGALSIPFRFVRTGEELEGCSHIILPGVGAFEQGCHNLESAGLKAGIRGMAAGGTYLLGICLGLQLLFESSEEAPDGVEGLALLPGRCRQLPRNPESGIYVPHIGWDSLHIRRSGRLLEGIDEGTDFYFLHSYHVVPESESLISGVCVYGIEFASVIEAGNIMGIQFHPEKSYEGGLALLSRFVSMS